MSRMRAGPLVIAGSCAAALVFASFAATRPDVGRACGPNWAKAAAGRPKALSAGGGAGVFVWHVGRDWHVRARANRGSGRLVGRISAARTLRVLRVQGTGAGDTVRARSGEIGFDLGLGGVTGFDFAGFRCDRPLTFEFSKSSGSTTAVFLGASRRAPQMFSLRAAGPSGTGLEGMTVLGPTCPLQSLDGECADKPVPSVVSIELAAANGTGSGQIVATVPTDAAGNFRVILPPGRYVATPKAAGGDSGVAKPLLINVDPDIFTRVLLHFSTSIRSSPPVQAQPRTRR